ncbi:MAG: ABC transporter ATP-binding protein, partial [Planctomycetes bacterium]|nr:ABC transporter ATP-binding protein [Planctomycetota bacterium]
SQYLEVVLTGGQIDVAELEQLPGTLRISREGDRFRLYTAQPGPLAMAAVRLADAKGLRISHLCTHKPSLEDVFLYFTGDQVQEPSR